MVIDCDTCVVRGLACASCLVSALVKKPGGRVDISDEELRAMTVLADAGLLPPLRLVNPDQGVAVGPASPGPAAPRTRSARSASRRSTSSRTASPRAA